MVERFFGDLTVNSIRRGVSQSTGDVINAIKEHINVHNYDPKPLI